MRGEIASARWHHGALGIFVAHDPEGMLVRGLVRRQPERIRVITSVGSAL
ncbi:hypothetical protein [Nonomuraea terrae]|nr:hypothetical protein [Nonomuraea terrae]